MYIYSIYNTIGQELKHFTITNNIDATGLSKGMYILK
ncbi:hypothetical protein E2488_12145 [Gramella jeungdoensis]|uniref:T9SS type A sorting domain-containing protein n=1 Tax=Gramella jeungdoensis TaxID=708091 RepID=A0A4Y8ASF1_9FLAO|nr:hypothetical protein E2488_12145 [Gramella jeungdoensis]